MTPAFYNHLFHRGTTDRASFLRDGTPLGFAKLVELCQPLFDGLEGLNKLIETWREAAPEMLRPIAGDIAFLQSLICMHTEACQALREGKQPSDSVEAYLNGMYEFWSRFERMASYISKKKSES